MNTYKRFGAVFVLAFVLSLLSTSIAAADSYIYLPLKTDGHRAYFNQSM